MPSPIRKATTEQARRAARRVLKRFSKTFQMLAEAEQNERMNLIETAKHIAFKAREGQTRRDGVTPYITHPEEVADMLRNVRISDDAT